MSTYAGESIAKKVARVRLYRRTRTMLKAAGVFQNGVRALFLIGPEAAEVGALKYLLRAEPHECIGVDVDADSCARLRERWHGVHIVNGDLRSPEGLMQIQTALDPTSPFFDFIHLDLMGVAGSSAYTAYATYSQFACPGTVAAMTFLRGREMSFAKETLSAVRYARRNRNGPSQFWPIDRRRLYIEAERVRASDSTRALAHHSMLQKGYLEAIVAQQISVDEGFSFQEAVHQVRARFPHLQALREAAPEDVGSWCSVGGYSYRGEVSPMGVLIEQLLVRVAVDGAECVGIPGFVGEPFLTSAWFKALADRSADSTSIIRKDAMADLLLEADALEREFGDKAIVAEILNVSTGTLAAWRAHRTMGTYA